MHRLRLVFALCAAASIAASGCAAASSGDDSNFTTYRKDLGKATPGTLARETRHILLDRYAFQLETSDSSTTQQVYRTRWLGRYPFEDEQRSGVVEAMTRITVSGRARGAGGIGATGVRIVELVAENMVRIGDDPTWQHGVMTPMFRRYIDDIAQRLKTELDEGVRVF